MGMFGIGSGNGQGLGSGEPAPDTKSLWGDMFGLGSLMKVITDPALVQHAHNMMQATIEGANANRRIEAKLDMLLRALGHEIDAINDRFPSTFQPLGPTALLVQNRADGARRHPPAGVALDDGSRGAAAIAHEAVGGSRHGEPNDGSADGA